MAPAPNHSRRTSCVIDADMDAGLSRDRSTKGAVRKFCEQEPSEYLSHGRNRVGVMPFGADAATLAGGSLAAAAGLIV